MFVSGKLVTFMQAGHFIFVTTDNFGRNYQGYEPSNSQEPKPITLSNYGKASISVFMVVGSLSYHRSNHVIFRVI